jgi:deferrochelatase/peroxidase EfeB
VQQKVAHLQHVLKQMQQCIDAHARLAELKNSTPSSSSTQPIVSSSAATTASSSDQSLASKSSGSSFPSDHQQDISRLESECDRLLSSIDFHLLVKIKAKRMNDMFSAMLGGGASSADGKSEIDSLQPKVLSSLPTIPMIW